MGFFSAVVTGGIKYVFMLAVAFGSILLGIKVRKAKEGKTLN